MQDISKRIEMLRELLKNLDLPAEKAQKIIENEPVYTCRKTKFGYMFLVAVITNTAARKLLEHWEKFEFYGETYMEDNGIARIIKIYGVDSMEVEEIKDLLNKIKKELKKERGL